MEFGVLLLILIFLAPMEHILRRCLAQYVPPAFARSLAFRAIVRTICCEISKVEACDMLKLSGEFSEEPWLGGLAGFLVNNEFMPPLCEATSHCRLISSVKCLNPTLSCFWLKWQRDPRGRDFYRGFKRSKACGNMLCSCIKTIRRWVHYGW